MTDEEFDELRPAAFAIAYRMLGSVSDAEDIVQEGLLRLYLARERGERIESPRAYLSTIVSRLALDQLRSAAHRHEAYVGEWLPEPLLTRPDEDPARKTEMADSLSLAFLVLLESLSPEQRTAFLLRDVFDEPYDRIAGIIGTSEQNVRQLATRARRRIEDGRPRFQASREQRDALAARFFAAAEDGDLEDLERLLADDVVLRGDGGGKAPAIKRALHGRAKVSRALAGGLRSAARLGVVSRPAELNGEPARLFFDQDGQLLGTMSLDIVEGRIQSVSAVVNPDKLHHLGTVGDLRAVLRRGAADPS